MRELKPKDSELIGWAETRSSTVSAKVWPKEKAGKELLVLVPAQSMAVVVNCRIGLPDYLRLAMLEQYFIENEEAQDV